jgi:uncharacterized membrane protein HdeD (DUF308 family)
MANASNAGTPSPRRLRSDLAALRAHAGWIVAFGIVLIIVAVLASVFAATIATVFYVGVMMLLAAVAEWPFARSLGAGSSFEPCWKIYPQRPGFLLSPIHCWRHRC